jgi:CTP:molybdopterin cytidylyltransferase MocA
VRVAGVLLGGGASTRFRAPKLEARWHGRRLLDIACANFLDAGLSPVVFAGLPRPDDLRVVRAEPGAKMIDTLRKGLAAIPEAPFAFAPADMPALHAGLVRELLEAFLSSGRDFLVPVFQGRRGHPAFALRKEPFLRLGDADGAREVWRDAGDRILHYEVKTPDVLFDVDTPEDLLALDDEATRRHRLVVRGDLRFGDKSDGTRDTSGGPPPPERLAP